MIDGTPLAMHSDVNHVTAKSVSHVAWQTYFADGNTTDEGDRPRELYDRGELGDTERADRPVDERT